MATAAEIGTVTIYINGAPILSLSGASIKRGGRNKSPLVTDQGLVLSTSEFTHGGITVTVPVTDIETIESLANADNVSGYFEADNGVVYTIDGLIAEMAGDWEPKKGGLECKFFGQAAKAG